jgi:hypothetical protein
LIPFFKTQNSGQKKPAIEYQILRKVTFMKKTIFKVFVISIMTGLLITYTLSRAYAESNGSEKAQKSKNIDSVELSVSQIMEKAEKGDIYAQYNLALMYAGGKLVSQDMDQATLWLQKAANQGHLEAQRYLASLYESGKWGFPQDKDKAEYWSNLGGRIPSATTGNQRHDEGSRKGISYSWLALFAALIVFSLIAIAFIIDKKKIKTIEPTKNETITLDSLESQFDQTESPQADSESEPDITFDDLSDSGNLEETDSLVEATGVKRCPYCNKDIETATIKCKYCGEVLDQ